jgi:phosphoglycerol transferase
MKTGILTGGLGTRFSKAIVFTQYLVTALLSVLIFCVAWRIWATDLHIPLTYSGDFPFSLAVVKGMIQNGWIYENWFTGAPYGAVFLDYPVPENFLFLMVRLIAFFSSDPFFVLNLFYAICFPLTALTSLYALKALKVSFFLALPGSMAFTFLPYHFFRLAHVFLAAYFMLPLVILVVVEIMEGQTKVLSWDIKLRKFSFDWKNPLFLKTILICVLGASCGVYYAFFSVFLLGVAFLKCFLSEWGERKFEGSLTAIVLGGIMGLTLLLNSLPFIIYGVNHASPSEPIAVRQPSEVNLVGLNLIQMLLPRSDHRIGTLDAISKYYQYKFDTSRLETTFSALGIFAVIGFLLSLGVLIKPFSKKDSLLKSLGTLNFFCLLLGTVGGLGTMFAFFISPQIRSVNRISVIIGFISIVVACILLERFFEWLQIRIRFLDIRFTYVLKAIFAFFLIAIVFIDQCGKPISNDYYLAIKNAFDSDRLLVQSIESQLPQDAMVFQLPFMGFPERPHINEMETYDHFKVYLQSSKIRWSYGGVRGRLAGDWYRDVARLPVASMLQTIVAAGFDGLYVDWAAYTQDKRGILEKELHDLLGIEPLVSNNQRQFFYDIRAYAADYRAKFTPDAWNKWVDDVLNPVYRLVSVKFTDGFLPAQSSPPYRWSKARSRLVFENLSPKDQSIVFQFDLSTASPNIGWVTIESNQWNKTLQIDDNPFTVQRELNIPSGQKITVLITCNSDPIWLMDANLQEVVFKLENFGYRFKADK